MYEIQVTRQIYSQMFSFHGWFSLPVSHHSEILSQLDTSMLAICLLMSIQYRAQFLLSMWGRNFTFLIMGNEWWSYVSLSP